MPGREALGLVARQAGLAVAIFQGFDGKADEVARFYFDLAAIVMEFFHSDIAFGFQTGIDHYKIVINAYDFGGNHFADTHFLRRQALFKERGKTFNRYSLGGCFNHWNQEVITPITETGVVLKKTTGGAAYGTK